MTSHLEIALSIHADAIARLRLREADLVGELESVQREIDALGAAAISLRRVFGSAAGPISRLVHLPSAEPRSDPIGATRDESGATPRARIGEQRYLMFVALRDLGGLSQQDIAEATGLTARRVRDQMKSDVRLGMVSEEGEILTLTNEGQELLRRFVEYRAGAGKPLPELPLTQAGSATDAAVATEADGLPSGFGQAEEAE